MRPGHVVPTGTSRTFGADEIIVSKTDPKGHITYANDVFLRVSGYTEDEILGQPHSLIRHPEMPRAVFQLLWDTVQGGKEIFAFVNNLAKDGVSYWVLAHVTPSFGANGRIVGYHSNRRMPYPGAIRAIEPVYRALLQAERAQPTGKAAVAAGVAALHETLSASGQTYEKFVWHIINDSYPKAA